MQGSCETTISPVVVRCSLVVAHDDGDTNMEDCVAVGKEVVEENVMSLCGGHQLHGCRVVFCCFIIVAVDIVVCFFFFCFFFLSLLDGMCCSRVCVYVGNVLGW